MATHQAVLAALRGQLPGLDRSRTTTVAAVIEKSSGIEHSVAAVTDQNDTDAESASVTVVEQPKTPAEVAEVALRAKNACIVCNEVIELHHDRTVRGKCRHAAHTSCLVPLILAGREHCTQCSPMHDSRTGYAVDAGNDSDMRVFTVLESLRFERDKVRDTLKLSLSGGMFPRFLFFSFLVLILYYR